MRRFKAGDVHLGPEPALDFGGVGAFKKELHGLLKVGGGRFDRSPWLATSSSGQRAT